MFMPRLLSGIILLIIVAFVITIGGIILCLATLLLSLIGLFELYRAVGLEKSIPGILGYVMTISYYLLLVFEGEIPIFLAALVLIILMSSYVFTFPKYTINDLALVFLGIIYVPMMFSFIYKVRIQEAGLYLVGLIFIVAWGCDTFAYCVGKLLGKHKLAPILSPKKSIEGAIGGLIGAVVLGIGYGYLLEKYMDFAVNMKFVCAVSSICVSVVSQIGDLAASAVKRNYNIKDYGTLIPGHGGVMDRFDSILFAAPILYIMMMEIK